MGILLLVFLSGCLKSTPLAAANGVAVTWVDAMETDDGIVELPDAVAERIDRGLADRGYRATRDGRLRDTVAPVAGPTILVRCAPVFDVQVNGRFRWNVPCDLVLSAPGQPDRRTTHRGAAHHVYYHQGAPEAVEEAAPGIARALWRLLEERPFP